MKSLLAMSGTMLCLLASCAVDGQPQTADEQSNETTESAALTDGSKPGKEGASAVVAPRDPESVKSADATTPDVSPLVVSPSISPSASFDLVPSDGNFTCPVGNLCPAVWDATVGKYKVFHLFRCTTYTVSHWFNTGPFGGIYTDNQTGNPTSLFLGQSHNVLASITPGGLSFFDWDPVFFIKNC